MVTTTLATEAKQISGLDYESLVQVSDVYSCIRMTFVLPYVAFVSRDHAKTLVVSLRVVP